MKYINLFKTHTSYETELSGGGIDINLSNVSYCEDVKDVHYTPYNLVRFYVGEITGTTHQTVSIYTDSSTSVDVTVSEGNKWYSYAIPKDKGLYKIVGDSVKNVTIKADINYNGSSFEHLIPSSTIEASFKGSNTSNVTNMSTMFEGCRGLTSLDLSNFNTSNVTNMSYMFNGCNGLTSLDLRNFDTSKVTNMMGMFENCGNLTSLDVSSFNTSNVTSMMFMFANCASLTSLDLSGWVINDATSVTFMLEGCGKLTTIRMVGCSGDTIDKINSVKPSSATIVTE